MMNAASVDAPVYRLERRNGHIQGTVNRLSPECAQHAKHVRVDFKRACDILKRAKRIAVFSGAGISAESGIPTFRGSGGLWASYKIEAVATPEAFRANPRFVWDFYFERRKNVRQTKPNRAHHVIADWQDRFSFVGVITQNIDGLHQAAGSREVQELHGNIWKARCLSCGRVSDDEALEAKTLRKCSACQGLLRPHIVWFGEGLDAEVIRQSVEWMRQAGALFVVGTSGVVEPAASLVRNARQNGVRVIEVNIERTALTSIADLSLIGKSGDIFTQLASLFGRNNHS